MQLQMGQKVIGHFGPSLQNAKSEISEYGFYNKFWNVSWNCTRKPEIQLHMGQKLIGHFGPTLAKSEMSECYFR